MILWKLGTFVVLGRDRDSVSVAPSRRSRFILAETEAITGGCSVPANF